MKSGKFITFEGGDGVGKTTQVKLLTKYLSEHGVRTKITREPGGDAIGEKIRELLKNSKNIDSMCETLLFCAARRSHYMNLIKPLLEEGYFVISDRFYDSSLVYQGILKGVSPKKIMQLKDLSIGSFEPDLTFILDIAPEVAVQRMSFRNFLFDEYDKMQVTQHESVQKGFRKIAEIFSDRAVLINARGPKEKVFMKIIKVFKSKFPNFN